MVTPDKIPLLQHIYIRRIPQHSGCAAIEIIAKLACTYLAFVTPVYKQCHKHALNLSQIHLIGHITDKTVSLFKKLFTHL